MGREMVGLLLSARTLSRRRRKGTLYARFAKVKIAVRMRRRDGVCCFEVREEEAELAKWKDK